MSRFISSLCCNPRVSQAALEEGSLSVRAKRSSGGECGDSRAGNGAEDVPTAQLEWEGRERCSLGLAAEPPDP